MAEALFGDINPGGKLPVTVVREEGQIPFFYNHKPSARRGYLFADMTPLFSPAIAPIPPPAPRPPAPMPAAAAPAPPVRPSVGAPAVRPVAPTGRTAPEATSISASWSRSACAR